MDRGGGRRRARLGGSGTAQFGLGPKRPCGRSLLPAKSAAPGWAPSWPQRPAEGGEEADAETGHLQLYLEELATGALPAKSLKAVQDLEAEGQRATPQRLARQARTRLATASDLSDEGRAWLEEQLAA